jgi:hypothetical protein
MEAYGGVEVQLTYKYWDYNVTTFIMMENKPKLKGLV